LFGGVAKFRSPPNPLSTAFGWNPGFTNESNNRKNTEIDLYIENQSDKSGKLIIEAKLTEKDFKQQDKNIVKNYDNFNEVFCVDRLKKSNNKFKNYQLIRNFLAAYKHEANFILLIDQQRIDLIREFYSTVNAVKIFEFQKKLRFVTWQELVSKTGKCLRNYISTKYFKSCKSAKF
jgi:hypothetical protein